MITLSLYDEVGKRTGQIALPLSKSRAGNAILERMRKAEPGWGYKSLEALDSGRLSVSHIASIFSGDEIEAAVTRRMEALTTESEELAALKELLGSGSFIAAQGGERARTRENQMIASWRTLVARKSISGSDMRKSFRAQSAADVLTAMGWDSNDGDRTRRRYSCGDAPGITVTLNVDGSQRWAAHRGAKELAKSTGSPVVCAADLLAFLTRLHDK